jgi:ribosomal protein S27AE
MGKSIITSKSQKTFYMAHICSYCEKPIGNVILIESVARKSYSFLQSKAIKICDDAIEKDLETQKERIKSIKENQLILKDVEEALIISERGFYSESRIKFLKPSCPSCLNFEPWINPELSKKTINEIKPENFPIILENSSAIELWARNQIIKKNQKIKEESKSLKNRKQVEEKTSNLYLELQKSIFEKDNLPELEKVLKKKLEISNLRDNKAKLGFLDLKGIKILNKKINDAAAELSKLESSLEQKKILIDKKNAEIKNSLHYFQGLVFGFSGEIKIETRNNSFYYYEEVNEIPEDTINKFQAKINNLKIKNKDFSDLSNLDVSEVQQKDFFCSNCGETQFIGNHFCNYCGNKL